VELDLVEPPAVAVVGAQPRRIGLRQPRVLASFRRRDDLAEALEGRQRVGGALALHRVDERGIAAERVEAGQGRGLVGRAVLVPPRLRHGARVSAQAGEVEPFGDGVAYGCPGQVRD